MVAQGGDQWADSGCVLKEGLARSVDGLHVGFERRGLRLGEKSRISILNINSFRC